MSWAEKCNLWGRHASHASEVQSINISNQEVNLPQRWDYWKDLSMLCWVYVNKEIAVTKLQYVGYITDIAYMYNCEEPLFNLKMGDIDSVLYNGPLALLAEYKNTFMNERFVMVCSWNSFLVFILIGKYVEATKASLELGEQ